MRRTAHRRKDATHERIVADIMTDAGLTHGGFSRTFLAPLQLPCLRWVLFDIGPDKSFMYHGIVDTDCDEYTEDAIELFKATGVNTAFEKLDGFPMDWKTNAPACIRFVREHRCPSVLEYGEYADVSAGEIKKALALKHAFSSMLDQVQ